MSNSGNNKQQIIVLESQLIAKIWLRIKISIL